jgi:hypothetical protein
LGDRRQRLQKRNNLSQDSREFSVTTRLRIEANFEAARALEPSGTLLMILTLTGPGLSIVGEGSMTETDVNWTRWGDCRPWWKEGEEEHPNLGND